MLIFTNVSSGYRRRPVLKNITFTINKGDFTGIIGPNGAGKSTLLKTATKILRLYSGEIFLDNRQLSSLSRNEIARIIAVVSQEQTFIFPYKVMDVVLLGRIPYAKGIGLCTRADLKIACEALEAVGAIHLRDAYIDELSSGERQRVIIARALAQQPKLLFLDEPTSHLDISHQVEIFSLLTRLNKENHLTIVAILHDLNLASEYCNDLILLEDGQVRIKGSPKDVLDYRIIEDVYKTCVIVKENPLTARPYVFVIKK